jgi:uncharacterized protein
MKLPDCNIWLALILSRHKFHRVASDYLGRCKAGEVIFCRSTQHSFLRLLTTAAVFSPFGNPPLSNAQAWSVYAAFLNDQRITFRDEPKGLESRWKQLAERDTASPKVWMDAYLAAFAMSGGYQIITTDAGFSSFPGLKLELLAG